MRTQDLNHFESLARALARGAEVDEDEVLLVLERTRRTREELDRRAAYHLGWAQQAARIDAAGPSELESYNQETKVLGAPEGLVIVVIPLVLMIVLAGLVVLIASS
ncbi:MAG: hypothetical protein JKY65_33775 [Planctomycetes bacterium]|nr:hypothetical protein [Planctomycetota bacterium]